MSIKLISGSASVELAGKISDNLGIPLCDCETKRFSDGECSVSINETVRGSEVYVIQSTCSPVNDNLMELLIIVDALKRASASRVIAVIPYFGYARQDRKAKSRDPISAKLVAKMIEKSGVDQVITMDLHAPQIQGFFDIPVDVLNGEYIAIKELKKYDSRDWMIVAPDVGSAKRARSIAERLGMDIAIVDKRRPKANISEVVSVIGDVEGMNVIIVDDMVDTAGTLKNAAEALHTLGAKEIVTWATHGVFSGEALNRIKSSRINQVFISESIPFHRDCEKITVLDTGELFSRAISLNSENKSLVELFK